LIRPLLAIVELTSPGNPEHVGYAARSVSLAMRDTTEEADNVGLAASVCNIGMIGVADAPATRRPGPLSLDERRAVQRHPEIGERLLYGWEELNPVMARIAVTVRHHHERWDGQGYPDGLDGDNIPTASRIITVVEAFHAMVSRRPYRDAMPAEVAAERLLSDAGTQFDERVVDAFLTFLENERT
jgi:HD-GYP domain-containing protein (c-di-GMP phosphodiesterase class II)